MGFFKALKGVAKAALPAVGSLVGGPIGKAIGTAGAGLLGASGAKKAAKASAAGYQTGMDALTAMYTQARSDFAPYTTAGTTALGQLDAVNKGDFSGFNNSPDYKYALEQGEQAINRAAAATGGRLSGNSLLALNRNAQGVASQNLGNYTNRLMQLAGLGSNATGAVTSAGVNTAGGVANLAAGQGDARASGIVNSTAATNSTIDSLVNGGLAALTQQPVGGMGGGIVNPDQVTSSTLGMGGFLSKSNLNLPKLQSMYMRG